MRVLRGSETHPVIRAEQLLDMFPELDLKVLAGRKGMGRKISSPRIQKPGLALAGVHEMIRSERIQIFGNTEISYLNNRSDPATRIKMLRPFAEHEASCFLVTKGLAPPGELLSLGDETGTPVLQTFEASSRVISLVTEGLTAALAPSLRVHGVFVDVYGIGLLIIGEGSIGKSESALGLVVRGHSLVSDDVVEIRRVGSVLSGAAPELLRYHMEFRGLGIVNVRELYGIVATRDKKDVDLVVELTAWRADGGYDRLGLDEQTMSVLGLPLPHILMPVAPGRNIAILLEVAARNLLLKRKGVHSARDFARRVRESMEPEQ